MWTRFKAWCERMSAVYPPRWYWPCVRIYGGPAGVDAGTCYLTRIMLGPETRWGRLYLHIFHREDVDRDPHDHPFPFWTLPVFQGYFEDVYEHKDGGGNIHYGCIRETHVPRWRVTKRLATHTHRVTRTDSGSWPLVTIVWRGVTVQKWGFWTHVANATGALRAGRFKTGWQHYTNDGTNANIEGIDPTCPGRPL